MGRTNVSVHTMNEPLLQARQTQSSTQSSIKAGDHIKFIKSLHMHCCIQAPAAYFYMKYNRSIAVHVFTLVDAKVL